MEIDLVVKTESDEIIDRVEFSFNNQVYKDSIAPFIFFIDVASLDTGGVYPISIDLLDKCGNKFTKTCTVVVEKKTCNADFTFINQNDFRRCTILDLSGVAVDVSNAADLAKMSLMIEGGTTELIIDSPPYFWGAYAIEKLSKKTITTGIPISVKLTDRCGGSITKSCKWFYLPTLEDCEGRRLDVFTSFPDDEVTRFCEGGEGLPTDSIIIDFQKYSYGNNIIKAYTQENTIQAVFPKIQFLFINTPEEIEFMDISNEIAGPIDHLEEEELFEIPIDNDLAIPVIDSITYKYIELADSFTGINLDSGDVFDTPIPDEHADEFDAPPPEIELDVSYILPAA